MSEYIQWADEYDELMRVLQKHWRAGITKPPKSASIPSFNLDSAFYPRAVAGRRGRVVEVAGPLMILVSVESKLRMQISTEDHAHRISSGKGLLKELETGDKQFDSKYILQWEIGQAEHLAHNEQFRKLIRAVEPFETIDIFRRKLRFYRKVENKKILDFELVDNLANQLVDLASIIDQQPTA